MDACRNGLFCNVFLMKSLLVVMTQILDAISPNWNILVIITLKSTRAGALTNGLGNQQSGPSADMSARPCTTDLP